MRDAEPEEEEIPAPGWARALLVASPFIVVGALLLLEQWLRRG